MIGPAGKQRSTGEFICGCLEAFGDGNLCWGIEFRPTLATIVSIRGIVSPTFRALDDHGRSLLS